MASQTAPGEVQVVASTSASAVDSATSKSVTRYKPRPARRQITLQRLEQIRQQASKNSQSGVSYNIWYEKWSGGDKEDHTKYHSETRCDIARDSGYTRGDVSSSTFICLLFARGCCPQGSDCTYLHRLPRTDGDDVLAAHGATADQGKDVFGRERTGDYRDDMGGIGSMQRVNRTLYIGKIHEEEVDLRKISHGGGANSGGPQWRDGGRTVRGGKSVGQVRRENSHKAGGPSAASPRAVSATEQVLRRHFSEWGTLERVRVLHHRGCAFVTYQSEASAQFAKEAMSNQSLDHGEILNVRWSTEDPNPAAQKRQRQELQDEGQKRITERMTDEQREVFEARARLEAGSGEAESAELEDKRRRIEVKPQDASQELSEEEMARLIEENERNWEEMRTRGDASTAAESRDDSTNPATGQPVSKAGTGGEQQGPPHHFLSSEALGGLAYLQSLRHSKPPANAAASHPPVAEPEVKAPNGLGGLTAYDSDSDDDE
ncbi:unnamed protein product [Parajaminaea phylloscopi]